MLLLEQSLSPRGLPLPFGLPGRLVAFASVAQRACSHEVRFFGPAALTARNTMIHMEDVPLLRRTPAVLATEAVSLKHLVAERQRGRGPVPLQVLPGNRLVRG